jgi:hypothetical protein
MALSNVALLLLLEPLIVNLIGEVEKNRSLLKTFKRVLVREWPADFIGYVCALTTNPTKNRPIKKFAVCGSS